jgi:hypothetical protein
VKESKGGNLTKGKVPPQNVSYPPIGTLQSVKVPPQNVSYPPQGFGGDLTFETDPPPKLRNLL